MFAFWYLIRHRVQLIVVAVAAAAAAAAAAAIIITNNNFFAILMFSVELFWNAWETLWATLVLHGNIHADPHIQRFKMHLYCKYCNVLASSENETNYNSNSNNNGSEEIIG